MARVARRAAGAFAVEFVVGAALLRGAEENPTRLLVELYPLFVGFAADAHVFDKQWQFVEG